MLQNMDTYYSFRKDVHKMYDNDVVLSNPTSNDLCSRILEIRDKNRFINSISASISSYSIEIEVDEGTSSENKQKIIDTVKNRVSEFLADNIHSMGVDNETASEYEKIISDKNLLCDVNLVGNSIKFNL